MDFGNPKKLRILTICVLFQVLKRLEEEEGGGHIVADFVTRLMRPKYLLKKSDRYIYLSDFLRRYFGLILVYLHTHTHIYIYIYIYICVCVCKCMCLCMCVYVYVLYSYLHYIFFPHPFFVCLYRFSTRCILTICNLIPNFPFVKLHSKWPPV